MDSKIKPVYFFHIPKTAGRYLYWRIFFVLESLLLKNNIQYKDLLHGSKHYLYNKIDDIEMLSMTSLRDPVRRTVSHWIHIYGNIIDPQDIKREKNKLLTFLEENPEADIIDYQTKFISYSGSDDVLVPDSTKLNSVIAKSNLDAAKSRLYKTNYIFNADAIDEDMADNVLRSLAEHFNVSLPENFKLNSVPDTSIYLSSFLYENLTENEKQIIESFMSNDMEIYNTNFLYR